MMNNSNKKNVKDRGMLLRFHVEPEKMARLKPIFEQWVKDGNRQGHAATWAAFGRECVLTAGPVLAVDANASNLHYFAENPVIQGAAAVLAVQQQQREKIPQN